MSLAYSKMKVDVFEPVMTVGARRHHLFETYVQRMFKHRRRDEHYSPKKTVYWLSFLAKRMLQRGQTIFFVEQVQSAWLRTRYQRLMYSLILAVFGGFFGLLFGGLLDRYIFELSKSPYYQPLEAFYTDFRSLPLLFGFFGIVFGFLMSDRGEKPFEPFYWSWQKAINWTIGSLLVGIALSFFLGIGYVMLSMLVGLCIMMMLLVRESDKLEKLTILKPQRWLQSSAQQGLLVSLFWGLIAALCGLINIINLGLTAWWPGLYIILISLLLSLALFGGASLIIHYILRSILYFTGYIPWHYTDFLDNCVNHIFLRRVGGGYIFTHRLLLDYFAGLIPQQDEVGQLDGADILQTIKQDVTKRLSDKSGWTRTLLNLHKAPQIEAVVHPWVQDGNHPWESISEYSYHQKPTLLPHQEMNDILNEVNRFLLILGEPGSGKTVTLLRMAQDFIIQAESDEKGTQPIPVVISLAGWTKNEQSFDRWLVTELKIKHEIPKRIVRSWLEKNRLLPLLDSLDQIKIEDRGAAIEAINRFREKFDLPGLVICSRIQEYYELSERLKLNGAIELLPLNASQINDYLISIGDSVNGLYSILKKDELLQELAKSPLTLCLLHTAYQEMSEEQISDGIFDTVAERSKHIFNAYLGQMFNRAPQNDIFYTPQQIKDKLAWLAQRMMEHHHQTFLIEHLQPSWLRNKNTRWMYVLSSRVLCVLIFGLVLSLLFILGGEISTGRIFKDISSIISNLGITIMLTVIVGIAMGVIDIVRLTSWNLQNISQEVPTARRLVLNILGVGVGIGFSTWLSTGLFLGWMRSGFLGLMMGFIFSLLFGLRGGYRSLTNDIQTTEALGWSIDKAFSSAGTGLKIGGILGILLGGFCGLMVGLITLPEVGLLNGLLYMSGASLVSFLSLAGLIGIIFGGIVRSPITSKTKPNQGINLTIKNATLVGLIFSLAFGIPFALMTQSIILGVTFALIFGIPPALWYGGLDIVQHYILRFFLQREGYVSPNYVRFLDTAVNFNLLHRVDGGYTFVHPLLMEHFAVMNEIRG